MGHSSSKVTPPSPSLPSASLPASDTLRSPPAFGRAQTMIDVTQALAQAQNSNSASGDNSAGTGGLQRSSSDTALNTSYQTACQKSYQQSLEWGRNEHFFKLAHTFHTNNY